MSEKDDIDTLARTLWGEARGQGSIGMIAVACVIANRVRNPRWWGEGWAGVCRAPKQFSCWNEDDPNRAKLLAVDARNPEFREATRIARAAIVGALKDPTGGADHYYTPLGAPPPGWSRGRLATRVIGDHVFYRLELKAP